MLLFFRRHLHYIRAIYIYIHRTLYLPRRDLLQNNKVCPPPFLFSPLLFSPFPFVPHSSAFVLRTYSLMAIYWRSR